MGYLYPTLTEQPWWSRAPSPGSSLAERRSDSEFARKLAIAGAAGVAIGLRSIRFIPIIKRMFTPSYTVFTCGLASLLLLAFYYTIDIRGWKKWSGFFTVFGMNSIFIYLLNGLLSRWLIDTAGILIGPAAPWIGDWMLRFQHFMRLAAEWYVCVWLFKRGIFFKL